MYTAWCEGTQLNLIPSTVGREKQRETEGQRYRDRDRCSWKQ